MTARMGAVYLDYSLKTCAAYDTRLNIYKTCFKGQINH